MPAKKTTPKTKQAPKRDKVSLSHIDHSGASKPPIAVSREIFGDKMKANTLTQLLRVYQANLHQRTKSTKTRGEVSGSTRKIYRQKGTGRARHGSLKAPIFVGGGVAFGPKRFKAILELPKKMRQQTARQVLLTKIETKLVTVISGLEKLSGKTKELVTLLTKIRLPEKKILFLVHKEDSKAIRAAGNVAFLSLRLVDAVSTLDMVKHEQIVITKAALEKFVAGRREKEHND